MLGTLEVHHHKDSEQHQHNGIGQQLFGIGIDGIGIKPQSAAGEIEVSDDILDDLAAGKGHNSEIVALETQCRKTDRNAEDCCDQPTDEHGKGQANRHGEDIDQCNRDKAAGEKANRHESRMPERKLSQKPDDKVKGNRQNDVDGDGNEHIGELAGKVTAVQKISDDCINDCNQYEGQKIAAESEFFLFHLLTPSHSLFCPKARWA